MPLIFIAAIIGLLFAVLPWWLALPITIIGILCEL